LKEQSKLRQHNVHFIFESSVNRHRQSGVTVTSIQNYNNICIVVMP